MNSKNHIEQINSINIYVHSMYIYICIQSIISGGICGKKTYYSFSIVHVAFCFIYVCSPNVIALVLVFFETLRHHVPKY